MKTDLQNRHYKKMGQQQLTFIQGMIPQNYHLTTIKAEVVEIQKTKNDNAIKGKISVSSILNPLQNKRYSANIENNSIREVWNTTGSNS